MINFCYTNIPIKLYKEKVDMGFTSVLHFDPIKQEDETYLCVECVPNYLVNYRVYKTAAIIASIGCIGWSFSVNYIITLSILGAYLIYLLFIYLHTNVCNTSRQEITKTHPWYFLELAGFIDVYLTYFLI